MSNIEVPVVRVVVRGCPSTRPERTNITRARNMLLGAFEDNHWPGKAMFTVTPGGFIQAPFPDGWNGARGWDSQAEDFQSLVPHARTAVDEVLTPEVLDRARGRSDYLTLGVDLNDESGKQKMDQEERGTHAELVGRRRCRTGRAGAVDWQILSGGLAGKNACPGSRPEFALASLRSPARARSGVPRSQHVQQPGLVQYEAR